MIISYQPSSCFLCRVDAGSTVLASQIEGESLGAVSKDLSAASQEIELPKVTASEAPLRAEGAPMPSNHVAPEVATCVASEVPLGLMFG